MKIKSFGTLVSMAAPSQSWMMPCGCATYKIEIPDLPPKKQRTASETTWIHSVILQVGNGDVRSCSYLGPTGILMGDMRLFKALIGRCFGCGFVDAPEEIPRTLEIEPKTEGHIFDSNWSKSTDNSKRFLDHQIRRIVLIYFTLNGRNKQIHHPAISLPESGSKCWAWFDTISGSVLVLPQGNRQRTIYHCYTTYRSGTCESASDSEPDKDSHQTGELGGGS